MGVGGAFTLSSVTPMVPLSCFPCNTHILSCAWRSPNQSSSALLSPKNNLPVWGRTGCKGVWGMGVGSGRGDLGSNCFLDGSLVPILAPPASSLTEDLLPPVVLGRVCCVPWVCTQPFPQLLRTWLSQACQVRYAVILLGGCGFFFLLLFPDLSFR